MAFQQSAHLKAQRGAPVRCERTASVFAATVCW